MNTDFKGRVIQLSESLDFGDGVSTQIIQLDRLFKKLGLKSLICTKHYHETMAAYRKNIEDTCLTDKDIAIVHFAGYSEYIVPFIKRIRCTKIFNYHNITPHSFFDSHTDLYQYCLKGRRQLSEILSMFHYYWGDSQYNLEELLTLGADEEKCSVVPIVVEDTDLFHEIKMDDKKGVWIFLGRIVQNKNQLELIELFADMRTQNTTYAQMLFLVGKFDKSDPYYIGLKKRINELGLNNFVHITGKLSDEAVRDYLSKASIYVSMSMHEGFGIPLIEASYHNLPVVALNNSAILETLGNGLGLAENTSQLKELISKTFDDMDFHASLLETQRLNAKRFQPAAVLERISNALASVIPGTNYFHTVSIVICTYNRANFLERCLDYLQYQTNPCFEVVVINGPSTDNTNEIIERYSGKIKTAKNPVKNLSISRNMGIELSNGDLVAFIDDDALPFDDWVDTLLREFNSRPLTLAGLGGPVYYAGSLEFQYEDMGINSFAEVTQNINSIGSGCMERSLLGTNTCFRSDILHVEKGFDEQFDYFFDESELCYRLQKKGYIIGNCDNLFLRHEFAKSENRSGKYEFNWFSICKNTAYFIAAYSGLKGTKLTTYIEDRMERERIRPLRLAYKGGEINISVFDVCQNDIKSGWKQGLIDAACFPRLHSLKSSTESFRNFPRNIYYPCVGVSIRKLHICIITKEFRGFSPIRGGIGTLYYHLACELLLLGHCVTVITPGDKDDLYKKGRFTVRFVSPHLICNEDTDLKNFSTNWNWSLSALHTLAVAHLENPVDIVEAALWDCEAQAVALLDKKKRPPVVTRLVTPYPVAGAINDWDITTHDARFLCESERKLIENSDAVVAISESISSTIEKEYNLERDARWRTSYCGIAYWPSFDFSQNYSNFDIDVTFGKSIPSEQKMILFIGRLERRKGVDILIQASKFFLEARKDACLVFAGRDVEGWESCTQKLLNKAILERVHFLGEVDDSIREKLLNHAYCVVFPSRYESFGLVPLESFVHGVPVIGAKSGAIPEVVSDGECGLLFETDDFTALAKCVEQILGCQMLHDQLSQGAKKYSRKFSSRALAIRSVEMYSSLLEGSTEVQK